MCAMNIRKLYYEDYYKGVDFNYILQDGRNASKPDNRSKDYIAAINEKIKSSPLIRIPKAIDGLLCSRLKTLYPGLITGVGLTHDSKNLTGAFSLGMHFDYTTGMPIIYGSSVKGVLRSYMMELAKRNVNDDDVLPQRLKGIDMKDLLEEVFHGKKRNMAERESLEREYIPMAVCERDVFFDAVILSSNTKGKILEEDSITPHTGGIFAEPIPIKMLKVAAGCTVEFRFKLHDTEIYCDGELRRVSAEEKREIFENILLTVGIGAKTNVGYGQLEKVD